MNTQSEDYKTYVNSRFYGYYQDLIKLKNSLESSEITFIFVQTPVENRIKNLTSFEKKRLNDWTFDFNNISESDLKIIQRIYPASVTTEYLRQVYDGAKVYSRNDGIKCLSSFRSKLVNVIDGRRLTFYQPSSYHNTVYIYGQCTARGTGVEDKDTVASYLQNMINTIYPDSYIVDNCGIGCGSDIHDDIAHMKEQTMNYGDIVILLTNLQIVPKDILAQDGLDKYDSSQLFNRPHDYGEWFTDMTFHTNGVGNKVIARYIFDILRQNDLLTLEAGDCKEYKRDYDIVKVPDKRDKSEAPKEIKKYIKSVSDIWHRNGVCGSIVMNCNPFTLGHLYLIETAYKQVDSLCIFVVEEDKSFFSFDDRIELVRQGVKHLNNVCVVPSGNYIISADTFPGYFYKDGNNEIDVDVTEDIRIFGEYIASGLGITKRFVGEEPFDYVTRQYNEGMKRILPEYGVEVIEIPRYKGKNQEIISASKVREYLSERNFEKLKRMVPKTTYEYLKKKYD